MGNIRLNRTKQSTIMEIIALVLTLFGWISLWITGHHKGTYGYRPILILFLTSMVALYLFIAYRPASRWVRMSFPTRVSRQLPLIGYTLRKCAIVLAVILFLTGFEPFFPRDIITFLNTLPTALITGILVYLISSKEFKK